MNISLGDAAFPSTKRGRSPRMPEGSAAANRGVAQSRVGNVRPWGDRAPALSLHRVVLRYCHSAADVLRGSDQQIGDAIGRVEIDRDRQTPEIGEAYMMGTIRTLRVDKGFGFIKSEAGQDYFFHQSAIYGEGITDLREGDGVEFEATDSPKGPRAVDVKRTTT